MGLIVSDKQWRRMNEIVEWYRFARMVSGVASKEQTIPLLIGGR